MGGHDGASKTGLRWFPLDDNSLADLGDRAARGDRSLFDFGVTAPIQAMQRRLREACERGGVPAFTPHGLRRMVVGRLLRSGVDAGRAAKLTGHSVQVMLRYYQEVTDEDRRTAADLAGLGELPGLDPSVRAPLSSPSPMLTEGDLAPDARALPDLPRDQAPAPADLHLVEPVIAVIARGFTFRRWSAIRPPHALQLPDPVFNARSAGERVQRGPTPLARGPPRG